MSTPTIAITIYILSTPDRLWTALTDPNITERYWSGTRIESDWKVGCKVIYRRDGKIVDEHVLLCCEPPRKLRFRFESGTQHSRGTLDARKEICMSAPKIAGLLTALAFVLVLLSAVLGSAIFGNQALADWSLIASQVCIWLAVSIFLGYFFHGCASEIRRIS